MKNRRKALLSMMLAAGMLMGTAVTAGASTLTVPSQTGHTYDVYQIMKGDITEDADKNTIISNAVWGADAATGYTGSVSTADMTAIQSITGTNQEKLSSLAKYVSVDGSATYNDIVAGTKLTDVPDGYYLITDAKTLESDNKYDDSITTYIAVVVNGDVTVKEKASVPTVDKQVSDDEGTTNDDATTSLKEGEAGVTGEYGETADHAIGENFTFQLTAQLPSDSYINDYKEYYLQFNDTMSDGVTYNGIVSVNFVVGEKTIPITNYAVDGVNEGESGKSWTLTISDLKQLIGSESLAGAKVVVTYNAYLNENAKVGNDDSNRNTVSLKYSNNPNWSGEGTPTGQTEEDTVFVFTYDMAPTKTDEDGKNELTGAKFQLTTDEEGEKPITLVDLGDGNYRLAKAIGETATTTTTIDGKTNSISKFNIKGLDEGTYYLVETEAPAGYNKLEKPLKVVVEATHKQDTETTASVEISYNGEESNAFNVENTKGSTLPTTGGMGTTIFYVFGSIFVLTAGIVLVTKKRVKRS